MQVPSQMLIDGKWVDAESLATSTVLNPANQEVLATLPRGGREDARAAIDAASEALRSPCPPSRGPRSY
jgi:betaine-aldehyde dehydrogenase